MTGMVAPGNPAGTTSELSAALARGEFSSVELITALLARADAIDDVLGVYAARDDEHALAEARRSDARRSRGETRSPLDGLPVGIKDIVATRHLPTRADSSAQDPWAFGHRDAHVVRLLRDAGCVIIGKTATMEYATGLPKQREGFPFPRNPWDPNHWTGGSSSGSASGVAAGLFPLAIGTDTAGSIRLPAGWCGVTGFKPTLGTVSNDGVVPLGYSFDHVGPLAADAEACLTVLDVITGDPGLPAAELADGSRPLVGISVGVAWHAFDGAVGEHVRTAARDTAAVLENLGATVTDVRLPLYEEGHHATMVGLTAESFEFHRDALAARGDRFGASARVAIAAGESIGSPGYLRAQRVRQLIRQELAALFAEHPIVLSPVALADAPRHGAIEFGPLVASFRTTYWNASGSPSVSIPAGLSPAGLPFGLQLSSADRSDRLLLAVAAAVQRHTGHHLRRPPEPLGRTTPPAPASAPLPDEAAALAQAEQSLRRSEQILFGVPLPADTSLPFH